MEFSKKYSRWTSGSGTNRNSFREDTYRERFSANMCIIKLLFWHGLELGFDWSGFSIARLTKIEPEKPSGLDWIDKLQEIIY